jgi:hypothetical protein
VLRRTLGYHCQVSVKLESWKGRHSSNRGRIVWFSTPLGLCANRGLNDIDRLSIYHCWVEPYLMKSQYDTTGRRCVWQKEIGITTRLRSMGNWLTSSLTHQLCWWKDFWLIKALQPCSACDPLGRQDMLVLRDSVQHYIRQLPYYNHSVYHLYLQWNTVQYTTYSVPTEILSVAICINNRKTDGMIDLNGSLTQGRQQSTYNPISISSDCYMGFGIRL